MWLSGLSYVRICTKFWVWGFYAYYTFSRKFMVLKDRALFFCHSLPIQAFLLSMTSCYRKCNFLMRTKKVFRLYLTYTPFTMELKSRATNWRAFC